MRGRIEQELRDCVRRRDVLWLSNAAYAVFSEARWNWYGFTEQAKLRDHDRDFPDHLSEAIEAAEALGL